MRRTATVIDLRPEGAFVLPDPAVTGAWTPDGKLLHLAGAIPQGLNEGDTQPNDIMPAAAAAVELAYKTATTEALGAYFDAILDEGFEPALAHKLLGMAFKNLELRGKTAKQAVQALWEDAP